MTKDAKAPAEQPTDPLTERVLAKLREALPAAIVASETTGAHPWIQVRADAVRDVAHFVRDDEELRFDCCHLISGVDWPDAKRDEDSEDDPGEQEVVYHLVSYSRKPDSSYRRRPVKNDPFLCLKVRVPRDRPEVPTVMDIWTGADWHERETWDLVGIRFTGRGELRRILLPEDWPGHPLRKDWDFPSSYHGIPIIPPEGP